MAELTGSELTVGTTAVVLFAGDGDGADVIVSNISSTTIYVADAAVSTADGFPVESGAVMSLFVPSGVALYAVAGTESNLVRVLLANR